MNLVITCVVREANSERNLLNLLHEQVSLIEKEYNGGVHKVKMIHNVVEQIQTLMHAVLRNKK